MNTIKLRKNIRHTKVDCPFGQIKDIAGREFHTDNNIIRVKGEYGKYDVDVDQRDILRQGA